MSQTWLVTPAKAPIARLVLAHGAGAAMDSDFLGQLSQQLALQQIEVWRFNFGYMQKTLAGKRQPPSKMAVLQAEMAQFCLQVPQDLPLFIGGKSMGGRVATLLAAALVAELSADVDANSDVNSSADNGWLSKRVQGVVVFGYPFCPPTKKDPAVQQKTLAERTAHFNRLAQPLLIVQGERDEFGGPALLGTAHWPNVAWQWLPYGDHDMAVLKKHPLSQTELIRLAAVHSAAFMQAQA